MSRWQRLRRNQTRVDFPELWKTTLKVSAALVLISVVALLVRGVNLGIEFEGGTVWEASAPDVSTADVRDALRSVGQADAKIQFVGGDVLRVRAELEATDASSVAQVSAALANLTGQSLDDISFNSISASWGGEITDKAIRALIVFFIVVAIYITLTLEWRMALAALVAVAHDIVITVGIYSLFQFEVTPATVIAFLTIMGYSLYDTLVVFDKARDFQRRSALVGRATYTRIMTSALNTVLMRSVNTTVTSVMPVLSMLVIGTLVLGAVTLAEFAVALLIGLLVGTYSSLFVAAPAVTWLKEREPEYTELRERLAARAQSRGTTVHQVEDVAVGPTPPQAAPPASGATRRPAQAATAIPPRPRKRKRR
ncbi:protein translocase subunit SecF [Candidatus Poriferisocius sp.]|uniref:protein translocase subunit SecF n=1 Tax=Candidatus Poriferisocius sp. TaxID=3101276 RepID=UPI003B01394A